jgi:hypothetical protein
MIPPWPSVMLSAPPASVSIEDPLALLLVSVNVT